MDNNNEQQEFEKYPKLAEFIQEYASFGSFSNWSNFLHELNSTLAALQSVTIISDIPNNEHYAHNLFMRCADIWTDEHDWVMTIERFKQCFIEWQRKSVTLVEEKEPEAEKFLPPDHGEICWETGSENFTRKEVYNLLWTQRSMITNDLKRYAGESLTPNILDILDNPRIPKY